MSKSWLAVSDSWSFVVAKRAAGVLVDIRTSMVTRSVCRLVETCSHGGDGLYGVVDPRATGPA